MLEDNLISVVAFLLFLNQNINTHKSKNQQISGLICLKVFKKIKKQQNYGVDKVFLYAL